MSPNSGEEPGGLPAEVARGAAVALAREVGHSVRIESARGVGGGCIHHALALETSAGPFFLKWNRGEAGSAFGTEARSLEALRRGGEASGDVRIPRVLDAVDAVDAQPGWLLLEYLPPSRRGPGYAERLGRGLAAIHRAGPTAVEAGAGAPADGDSFGWPEENRIGSLPQPNPWMASWPGFWRDVRLRPQLEALADAGYLDAGRDRWPDDALHAVEPALADASPNRPHLIHGDLWSGNVHPGPSGRPILVDPASCLGHGEVDLAMARLFGGFDEATFRAYAEVVEIPPGFEELRLPMYQLYFLLVHVRLFGASYLGQTRRAAEQVIAAVR